MTAEHKRKIGLANKGKIRSPETRKRLSISHIGLRNSLGTKRSPEWRAKHGLLFIGRKVSDSTRSLMSIAHRGKKYGGRRKDQWGKNNCNWRGGVSTDNQLIRHSSQYKEWRTQVFVRDKWTCQHCKRTGVSLQADHIKPFAYYPTLRFDLNNGRTLCVECHRKTATYGSRKRLYERV
jgi:5-methylcytosine-specific restriction endonuclease McrA